MTPRLQFIWSTREAKTMFAMLSACKVLANDADHALLLEAIRQGAAARGVAPELAVAAFQRIVTALLAEPERGRFLQSVIDRLHDWLRQHGDQPHTDNGR